MSINNSTQWMAQEKVKTKQTKRRRSIPIRQVSKTKKYLRVGEEYQKYHEEKTQ